VRAGHAALSRPVIMPGFNPGSGSSPPPIPRCSRAYALVLVLVIYPRDPAADLMPLLITLPSSPAWVILLVGHRLGALRELRGPGILPG